jgi:hypothetical protein
MNDPARTFGFPKGSRGTTRPCLKQIVRKTPDTTVDAGFPWEHLQGSACGRCSSCVLFLTSTQRSALESLHGVGA